MIVTNEQKLKTGVFVIICIGLLALLLFVLAKRKKIFGNNFTVYAHFKNIAGTKEGNFVRYAGINIGTVETIKVVNDTTVQLLLTLDREMQPFIKKDAVASIGNDGLMGDKLLHITPGNIASPSVKDGDTIFAINPMDVDRIINNLSSVSDNAAAVTEGLAEIVAKINNGEGSIGRLLTDEKMADRLEGTIEKANKTVTTIDNTAKSVNENMEAAKKSILLRGYFKKKEKQRIKDSIEQAKKGKRE